MDTTVYNTKNIRPSVCRAIMEQDKVINVYYCNVITVVSKILSSDIIILITDH